MTWLILLAAISIGCIVWSNRKLSAYKAKAAGSPQRMVDRPAKNRVVEIDTNIRTTPIVFEDFLEPLPETVPVVQKRRGTSNEIYLVNLRDMSCTCTNWEADRCRFPKSDIRRICKHLAMAFLKHDLLKPDFVWLLDGPLFPFPSKPYCAAIISCASGQFRAIRFEGVEWVDVLADTGLKTRPFDRLGFNIGEKRWVHEERAPNRKWIGPALCGWLASSASRRYVPCPKISEHSVEIRKAADEKSRMEHEEQAANATRCFVCGHQMAPLKPEPKTKVRCPHCGNQNYVSNNGSLFNPERIAIYAQYNGNYDDRKQVGSAVLMAERHREALDKLKADYPDGLMTKEYRAARSKLNAAHKKEAEELSAEKEAAMVLVRQREEKLKQAVREAGAR